MKAKTINQTLNEYSFYDKEKEIILKLDKFANLSGFKDIDDIQIDFPSDVIPKDYKREMIKAWEANKSPWTTVILLRMPYEDEHGKKVSQYTIVAQNRVWEYEEPYEKFLDVKMWEKIQDLRGVKG